MPDKWGVTRNFPESALSVVLRAMPAAARRDPEADPREVTPAGISALIE